MCNPHQHGLAMKQSQKKHLSPYCQNSFPNCLSWGVTLTQPHPGMIHWTWSHCHLTDNARAFNAEFKAMIFLQLLNLIC